MLRVIGKRFTSYDSRSDEYTDTVIQYLQERKTCKIFGIALFHYWRTIDKEEVPTYAWIQRNTLGTTDWESKWVYLEGVSWANKKRR